MNGLSDPIMAKTSFLVTERTLYRAGEEAYHAMVERTLTRVLENQGGLPPFRFTYTPYDDGTHDRVTVFGEEEIK